MKTLIRFMCFVVLIQFASSQNDDINELLSTIEGKKSLILYDINNLEINTNTISNKLISELDSELKLDSNSIFEEHYKRIEQKLKDINLPADQSTLDIVVAQVKAGLYTSSDLEKICVDFVKRALNAFEADQNSLLNEFQNILSDKVKNKIDQASTKIRKPFDSIIIREIPIWSSASSLPLSDISTSEIKVEDALDGNFVKAVAWGSTGVFLVGLVPLILRKVRNFIIKKISGKVLLKVIPGIGIILLAYDLYDLSTSRSKFEQDLRSVVLEQYIENFSFDAIWSVNQEEDNPFRNDVLNLIGLSLSSIKEHCKNESLKIIEVTDAIIRSEHVRNYIEKYTDNKNNDVAINTGYLIENIKNAYSTFGNLIEAYPTDTLLAIRAKFYGNDNDLRYVVDNLQGNFFDNYTSYGDSYLQAIDKIGPVEFVELVNKNESGNWKAILEAIQFYSIDLSRKQYSSLIKLLSKNRDYKLFSPESLQLIEDCKDLSTVLLNSQISTDKIANIFNTEWLTKKIDQFFNINDAYTLAFINIWPITTWRRYDGDERITALFKVADYRNSEKGQTVNDFAKEVLDSDEITSIYIKGGVESVKLWDHYVDSNSGSLQKNQAHEAIDFLSAGYDFNDLLTPKNIEYAKIADMLPVFKFETFYILKNIGYFGLIVFLLVTVLLFLYFIFRLFNLIPRRKKGKSIFPVRKLNAIKIKNDEENINVNDTKKIKYDE